MQLNSVFEETDGTEMQARRVEAALISHLPDGHIRRIECAPGRLEFKTSARGHMVGVRVSWVAMKTDQELTAAFANACNEARGAGAYSHGRP